LEFGRFARFLGFKVWSLGFVGFQSLEVGGIVGLKVRMSGC